jgi:hypothetical protein
VVLVVGLPVAEGKLQNGAGDASQEDGLLVPGARGVAQVGQQAAVEDALDLLGPVLLGLARGELLLQVVDGVFCALDPRRGVELGVQGLLEVGVQDVGHGVLGDDGVVDLAVVLHAEGLHEDDQGDLARGGGDGHDQDAVLLLLHQGEGPVALAL